jgi:RNA 2',3'-cyclic 3'-phosphodiesterase
MQAFILLPTSTAVNWLGRVRLFTAVDIPEEIKSTLVRLRPAANLRWTPAEKLHITTKFIGDWAEQRLDEMKRALAEVTEPDPIEIHIRRVGWLPNDRHPRVLYAGVEASESLCALAIATERSLERIGVAVEDRIYRPHVTLARVKDRLPSLPSLEQPDFGSYRATSFFLYLSAAGKYTKLQEFPLNK